MKGMSRMDSQSNSLRLCCLAVLIVLCGAARASVQEFLRASSVWLPDAPIVMSREAVGTAVGLAYAGYDPITGAWFLASASTSAGRDASGRSYLLRSGHDPQTPVHEPLPYHIATLLPVTIVASMHERPGIITEAVRRDDAWFVTYRVTTNLTKTPPTTKLFLVEFDAATGRVLSQERADSDDPQRIEFDQSNPRLERQPDREGGPQHEVSLQENPTAADFAVDAVAARMKAVEISLAQKASAIEAVYTENGQGGWTAPAESNAPTTVPYAGSTITNYRIPLLAGGILLVFIAGVEIFRRRSG